MAHIDDATHIKGSKIRSYLDAQIDTHQTMYEAVATLLRKRFLSAEDVSFPTIAPEYNGSLAASNRHDAGVAYV